jgi:hypothetical protein
MKRHRKQSAKLRNKDGWIIRKPGIVEIKQKEAGGKQTSLVSFRN